MRHTRQTPKTKALIFDFHGVLSLDEYWQRSRTPIFACVQNYVFGNGNKFVKEWMLGNLSSEQICALLADTLELDYRDVWQSLVESCETFSLQTGVVKKIRQIRSRMPVFLVTTNMDCFSRFVVPSMNLEAEFDKIINSSDVGCLKDHEGGDIFQNLASEVDIPISDMLLLDDSVVVGDIFKKLGGSYLQVERGPIQKIDFELVEARIADESNVTKMVCGTNIRSVSGAEKVSRLRA